MRVKIVREIARSPAAVLFTPRDLPSLSVRDIPLKNSSLLMTAI